MHEVSAAVMAVSLSLTINLIVSILVCVHFGHPHHSHCVQVWTLTGAREKPLTYEQVNSPYQIRVTRGWSSCNVSSEYNIIINCTYMYIHCSIDYLYSTSTHNYM